MGTEIERKFLIRDASWRGAAEPGVAYRQGYFAGMERCSVRVRIDAGGARLNIKGATIGIERYEYEYPIPLCDAEELLERCCLAPVVRKTRYRVPHGAHVWEIDVFEGDNAGLVVAEIELGHSDESFERPQWLGGEVSDDARYYNVSLVAHPFKDW